MDIPCINVNTSSLKVDMTPSPSATFSSREFAHELARVKRAALEGPVFITDRGKPTYALMAIEDFRKLSGGDWPGRSLLDVMDKLPSTAGIDFEPGLLRGAVKPIDLE
jgi:prevent-host-death family protein